MTHHALATRRVVILCTTFLLAGGLTACGSGSDHGATTGGATTGAASASPTTAVALALDDGWVKAVDVGTGGMEAMSAMFGVLRNTSGQDITVTGGSSPEAGVVELHETVKNDSGEMQMQPRPGGFVVPAGGTRVLQPGGDHVMLMELTGPLASGTDTTVTLTTSAGTLELTVPVRAFAGAEESYAPMPSAS